MDMDLKMWNDIKETVRKKLNTTQISYDTWIAPLDFSIKENKFFIILPAHMEMARKFIEIKYGEAFQSTLREHLGDRFEVKFVVGDYT